MKIKLHLPNRFPLLIYPLVPKTIECLCPAWSLFLIAWDKRNISHKPNDRWLDGRERSDLFFLSLSLPPLTIRLTESYKNIFPVTLQNLVGNPFRANKPERGGLCSISEDYCLLHNTREKFLHPCTAARFTEHHQRRLTFCLYFRTILKRKRKEKKRKPLSPRQKEANHPIFSFNSPEGKKRVSLSYCTEQLH